MRTLLQRHFVSWCVGRSPLLRPGTTTHLMLVRKSMLNPLPGQRSRAAGVEALAPGAHPRILPGEIRRRVKVVGVGVSNMRRYALVEAGGTKFMCAVADERFEFVAVRRIETTDPSQASRRKKPVRCVPRSCTSSSIPCMKLDFLRRMKLSPSV